MRTLIPIPEISVPILWQLRKHKSGIMRAAWREPQTAATITQSTTSGTGKLKAVIAMRGVMRLFLGVPIRQGSERILFRKQQEQALADHFL